MAQVQWPPYKSNAITSIILLYHNNVYVSKTTLQICSTVNQKNKDLIPRGTQDEANDCSSEYPKNIADLFAPMESQPMLVNPNMILIEGTPGIGKTMLANEIAFKWKNIPLLCKREFLFLIYLKDPQVQNARKLGDLLHIIFQNGKLSCNISEYEKSISISNGANLAIIFDGYDELPHQLNKTSFISSLINRSCLKSSLLIITSRPSVAKHLHAQTCRRVELLGLTEADRDRYLKDSLDEHSKCAIIIEHFKNYPLIDTSCRIPFNLNIFLYLYCEKGYLPTNKTEMFENFIYCTMSHFQAKSDYLTEYASETETDKEILQEFGKLSFQSLKVNKITFSHQDLQNNCGKYLEIKQGNVECPYGLLWSSHWSGSQENSYSFLHVTIQEYLAACYLSEQEHLWGSPDVEATLDQHFWDERFFNMWVFYIGITKGKQCTFVEFIKGQAWWEKDWYYETTRLPNTVDGNMKCLHLVKCFMEAKDSDSCQKISAFHFNEFVDLSNNHITYEGLSALCFAIIHSLECSLTELNLSNCRIGDDGCKYIHTQLVSTTSNFTIRVLNLSENQLTKLSVNFIVDLIVKLDTKTLILSGNLLCCECTSKLIQKCSNLHFLDVTNNNILSEDVAFLNCFYNTTNNLSIMFSKETICLVNCACLQSCDYFYRPKYDYQSFSVILTAISGTSSNHIDDKFDNAVLRCLYLNCTLNENLDIICAWVNGLWLSKLHLIVNPKHSEEVYLVIARMKSLKEVCIGQLTDDIAHKIVERLDFAVTVTSISKFQAKYVVDTKSLLANFCTFGFQSLRTLWIWKCSIDIEKFAAAIRANNNWDSISLLECNISDDELSHLYDDLHSSEKITVHTLNLKGNNIKHAGILNNLLHQWKIRQLYLACNDLQYSGFMEIVLRVKNGDGDLVLEVLDVRGNNNITELEGLCEDLLLDMKYKVNLTLLSNDHVVIKTIIFDTPIMYFLMNSGSLNLYIQPISDCFDTFRGVATLCTRTSIQKLYVSTSGIAYKIIKLLVQIQINKPFDLYLNVKVMADRDIDYLFRVFPHKSLCVQTRTRMIVKYFNVKNSLLPFQSKIVSLSLHKCILDKDILYKFGKIIANSNQRFEMVSFCECGLHDADLQLLLVKEKENYLPFIKVLSLSGNSLSPLAASSIIELLRFWRVEQLSVRSNQLQDNGIEEIVKHVVQHNTIKSLDLTDNAASVQLKEVCEINFFNKQNEFSFLLMDNGLFAVRHINEVPVDKEGVRGLYVSMRGLKQSSGNKVLQHYDLSQSRNSFNYLYVVCSQFCIDGFKNTLQFLHHIEELYLDVESLLDKDADDIISSFGRRLFSCVIVSRSTLKIMNGNDLLTLKGLSTCRRSVVTVELNNCMIKTAIQCLANIFNSCSGNLFAIKLKKCYLDDHHFKTLMQALNDNRELKVKEVDLSHNLLSSASLKYLQKMMCQFMPEHFVLSSNRLSYNSISTVIKYDCTNLKYLSVKHNYITQSDADKLCKEAVLDRNFKIQCFLIAESMIVDVGACDEEVWNMAKGNNLKKLYIKLFSSNNQRSKYLKYLRDLLSSFSSLESLFVLITGPFDFDNNILYILQRLKITKRLVVYTENLPDDILPKLTATFTSSINVEIFSQKKIWISNSDCKMIGGLFDYISDDVDHISIMNSPKLHEDSLLLANFLSCQCKQIKHLNLTGCCSTDYKFDLLLQKIVSQFQQTSIKIIVITKLNLSFNQLSSVNSVIKAISISRVEELILTGNKIGNTGAILLIEELTVNLNTVKYMNINHNEICKVENHCQKYYTDFKFEYSFVITNSGIIITKGFLTDYPAIWQDEYLSSFSSVFLASKDLLSSRELQNIIIKSNQKLERLYMVLLQNSELQLNSELISSLLVDIQELCLFAPSLSSKSRINIWEKHCRYESDKRKVLLLSKEALQAKNFESKDGSNTDSSNILIKGFEYCHSSVINIQIMNCKLSPLIMNNLTQVLINNRELHHLEICNTDDCEVDSIILKRQDVTVKIKSVSLLHNKLTTKFLNSFINFVNCWNIDELYIEDNEISFDGFKMLVDAIGNRESLKVIRAQQNGIEIEKAEELCKIVFFDPVYSIGCLRLKEHSKLDILVIKSTLTSSKRICSCTYDFVKSHYQSRDKEKHSTSQSCLFIETDYDSIDPLVWTYVSKLCIVAPVKDQVSLMSNLKENKYLTEIYLYVNNLMDFSLKEISKNLPALCQTTVFLTAEVFLAKYSSSLYINKGLQIVSSTTTNLHTIIINYCSLSVKMLTLLKHILDHCHLWECLDLSYCSLGDNIKHFLQPLSGEITVKTVKLSFNELQQTTAASIIKAILHWNTNELFINDNNLRDTGAHKIVAEMCKHHKKCQLTVLNLYKNNVTLDKARASLIKVHKAFSNRQMLFSMDSIVLVQDMQHFPDDLTLTSIIQTLKLFCCFNCGQDIISSVNLSQLASLNEIVVCNNDFNESCFSESLVETANEETAIIILLGKTLKVQNGHLTLIQMVLNTDIKINSLDFIFCEVNDYLLNQIAHLVKSNGHLQLLSLKGCNLSNDFCKVLLQPLQDTNNLQVNSLILSSNNITSSAVEDLSKLCCILSTETLYLNDNELDDDGIKKLARNLSGENHNLQYINLMSNNAHYMTEYEFNMLSNTKDFSISVEINPNTQQFYKSLPPHFEDMSTTNNLYCIECIITIQNLADILSLNLNRLHLFGTLHTNEFSSLPQSTFIQAKEIIIVLKNCDDQVAFEIFRNTDTIPIVIVSQFSIQAKNIKEAELINIALRWCQKHCLKKFLFHRCDVTKCFNELALQSNSVCDKNLEIFQMQNCCLSDTDMTALVKSLTLIRITSDVVDLSYNRITMESSKIIGIMVKDWQIKKLHLNYNQISLEGVNFILSTCALTYHLQDITFKGNSAIEHLQQTETVVDNAVNRILSLDSITFFNESRNNCIIMVVCSLVNFYFLQVSVDSSDKIILEGEQNSLEMENIRIYINARKLTLHYIKEFFTTIPNLYHHLDEFFILYDGTLSQFYDEPFDTNSVMNIKLIYSKETPLKGMEYPIVTIRINSNSIIPKLRNFCMLSGITELCVFLHVTQQSYVDNTIAYLLNDGNPIAGLRELIFKYVSNNSVMILSELVSSNPYLESLNITGNDMDDATFLQVCSELNHLTSLRYLNLSQNRLTSFSIQKLNQLISSCPVEELILEGNQVNIDGAKMVMENIIIWDQVNFIDIGDNDVFDADNLCQVYFFDYKFQFSFILTENGIIITRGLPTKQDNDWSYKNIEVFSLYIGNDKILDQNIFDSMKLDEVSRVYIGLLQNRPELSPTTIMPLLEVAQDIYLCTPSLNIPVLEIIYQHHHYKSVLIMGSEFLYAANCKDEKLANILDFSKDSIKKLEVYNCTLSFSLLHKFASLLYSSSKEWECISFCSCSLCDDDLSSFTEKCSEYKKEQTKIVHCVNLSNNTLTTSAVDKLVSLLDMWRTKELYISHNNLQYSVFERLINARLSGSLSLRVLDIQYNDIDCSRVENLCEEIFLNPITPFCQVILKEEHYNCMVLKHGTTDCVSPSINNFAVSSDKSSSTDSRSSLFLQANDNNYEVIHQLTTTMTLNKLYLIADISDQSIVSTCLKNQRYLTELYLYAKNWLSDRLIIQQLTSSCQIKLVVSSDRIEANKVVYLQAITEGLSLLPSCVALNTININHCRVNKECLILLNTFLWSSTQPKSLKCLDLSSCSLENNVLYLLKSPIKSMLNISIETVDLSSNKLNSAAMDLIGNFIVCLSVKQLYLNDNKIASEGIEKLARNLITIETLVKGCKLEFLDITGNLLEHISIKAMLFEVHKTLSNKTFCLFVDELVFVQGASQIPEITIFMKHCYVFNCDQIVVGSVTEKLCNPKEIIICNVDTVDTSKTVTINKQIQDICEKNTEAVYAISLNGEIIAQKEQADWIEIILSKNSTVNFIRLQECNLSTGVISKLAKLIENNKDISEISLTGCTVTDANCKLLSQSLSNSSTCCKVTSLNVSGNLITSSAVNEIVDLVCTLKIEKLYMNNNNLCDSGISQFAKMLAKKMHSLIYAEFKGNNTRRVTEYEFISNSRCELMQVSINKKAKLFNGILPTINQFESNIEDMHIINYNFNADQLTDILAFTLKKLYLHGTCNISNFDTLTQGISIDIKVNELLIILNNLNDKVAKQIFDIAQCLIVIASKSSIRAKNCDYAELINMALHESQERCLNSLHFIACDFVYQEFTVELQNSLKNEWKCFQLKHCYINDDRFVYLVKSLTSVGVKSEVVDLSYNLITSQSAETIRDMINNWQIGELYLNDNQISLEGIENIVKDSIKAIHLQKLNLENNSKTDYIHHTGNDFEIISLLNETDYFKQPSVSCIIMIICGNDMFYFLTLSVVYGEEVISGEQSILEKVGTKIYVIARSFKSSHLIDQITRSRHYEELYILSDDGVIDCYKEYPLIQTAVDIGFVISTTPLHSSKFQECNYPSLRAIVNSCQVIPKKPISLPNMAFFIHIIPKEVVVNAIKNHFSFIAKFSKIRALYINCDKITVREYNVTGSIIDILEANTDLECLNISDNNINDDEFSTLSEKLKCISSLKSIDIGRNDITDKSFNALELVVQNNCGLKEINFSDIHVNEIAFSASLKRLTHLTTLKLSHALIGMSQDAATSLGEIIANNVDLECLDISGNQIADNISKIFESMQHHKSLRVLNVSSNQISVASIKGLFTVIVNNHSLQDIDLSNNKLSCKDCFDVPSITKSFKRKQLKKLNVRYTGATNSDTNDYIAVLKNCNALEEIDLSLGNLLINSILIAMNHISTLRKLCLRKCNIKFSDTNNLASLISQNTLLEFLDISKNAIENIGFKRVLSALVTHANSHLKVLQVADSKLILNSVLLEELLPNKLPLLELDISYNTVEESFMVNLFENFIDLNCLQLLNIGHTTTDPSSRVIHKLMTSATELKELDISGHTLTCDRAISFQKHQNLKAVTLRNCNINSNAAEKLKLLFNTNNLKCLDVSNNPIEVSFPGIPIKIIHRLKLQDYCVINTNLEWMLKNNSLHELHLCDNDLGDKQLGLLKPTETLTKFIARFALSLHKLCLRQCNLKDDEMFRIISKLKCIKTIHLCNNKIKYKSSHLSKLKHALEANNSLEMLCILNNSMSQEETITFTMSCADNCSSIRCIQIPIVDNMAQMRSKMEEIKEKRSVKRNYSGLYAVYTENRCFH